MRPKALGATHVGVWLGGGAVYHNAPGHGEHVSSVADFANGASVAVVRTNADASTVVARVRTRLVTPQSYDVVNNNCEHAANAVVTGRAVSPQLQAVVIIAIGVLMLYCIARRL